MITISRTIRTEQNRKGKNILTKIKEYKEKQIDLILVKKLQNRLEKTLTQRETWKDRSHISKIQEIQKESENLNSEQQKY